MKKLKFFKSNKCNDIVIKFVDENNSEGCCEGKLQELVANTVEASTEKHMPIVNIDNGFVDIKVGSINHPMEENHYINFVAVETESNYIIKTLTPDSVPEAKIFVDKDKVVAVYEYCNLHGLWKTEL